MRTFNVVPACKLTAPPSPPPPSSPPPSSLPTSSVSQTDNLQVGVEHFCLSMVLCAEDLHIDGLSWDEASPIVAVKWQWILMYCGKRNTSNYNVNTEKT